MPPAAGGNDSPQTPSKRKERVPHSAFAGHGTLSFRPKAVRRAPLRIRETPRFFSREECKDVGKGFLTVNPEEGKSVETGKGYLRIGSSGGDVEKAMCSWRGGRSGPGNRWRHEKGLPGNLRQGSGGASHRSRTVPFMKVFEGRGVGIGEGRGKLSPESFPLPSPTPSSLPSKTFTCGPRSGSVCRKRAARLPFPIRQGNLPTLRLGSSLPKLHKQK